MKEILQVAGIFMFMLSGFCATSQEGQIDQAILDESCDCIGKIDINISKSKKNEALQNCISASIIGSQTKKLVSEMALTVDTLAHSGKDAAAIGKNKSYVITVDKDYDAIQKRLLAACPRLKELIMVNNEKFKNSVSDKKKAKECYAEGERYYQQEKYDLALVEYNKAVKSDPKFAFAWDNMGMCYRKLNRYKQAIACYDKSLALDPKGSMPLLNKAVAYSLLEDYKNAADAYLKMVEIYPNDPEGYYGAGRMFYYNNDYEKGIDYIFQAYFKYKESGSPYVHDAESNISAFYNDMKSKGKLEIFNGIAEKYKVTINTEK